MTAFWPLGAAGLFLGFLFGVVAHRTHFCTMGAISDLILFGGRRRLRSWLLAIAIALLLTQLGVALGLVAAGTPPYRAPELDWLGAVVGGTLFGFGMVTAGGCVARNLVRLGSGSLRSLLVVVVALVSAALVTLGPLHIVADALGAGSVDLPAIGIASQSLDSLLVPGGGLGFRLAVSTALAVLLAWYCLKDPQFRSSSPEIVAGTAVGLLVAVAWALTSAAGRPASLNFIWPLRSELPGGGAFAAASLVGTLLGASLSSRVDGSFRPEGFASGDDLRRHLLGAVLMGVGGGLAGGCTIALGIAGVGVLGLGSFLALAGMAAGARAALRHLEGGPLLPRFRRS